MKAQSSPPAKPTHRIPDMFFRAPKLGNDGRALRSPIFSEIRLRCHRRMEVEKAEILIALGADFLANEWLFPALITHDSGPGLVEGIRIVHLNLQFQPLAPVDCAP